MGHTIYPIWFYAQNKDLIMPSTTKEIIEVTQLNMQKARLAQIEVLNKINKCNNQFLMLTQEPYCYKATLALLPQNATPEHQLQQVTDYKWQK